MKLKLEDVKIQSFVTKDLTQLKGGIRTELVTEAQNCTYPQVCGVNTNFGCATNWCPTANNECGHTDLC